MTFKDFLKSVAYLQVVLFFSLHTFLGLSNSFKKVLPTIRMYSNLEYLGIRKILAI